MEPSGTFLLSHGGRHVLSHGVLEDFDTPTGALEALRTGRRSTIVGALPFDIRDRSALFTPVGFGYHDTSWHPDAEQVRARPIVATVADLTPSPAEHVQRVSRTLGRLADPAVDLSKVVLARTAHIQTAFPVTPRWLAATLSRNDPQRNAFIVDLGVAGDEYAGVHLVGASPEVLIRKRGRVVSCHPLAGSAPRSPDPVVDAERGRNLAESAKDHLEHRYVVDAIVEALRPLCSELTVPDEPELVTTARMWHLGTPISGLVDDVVLTSLDLALAVHPTPAVCGTPTDVAREHILALEGDRRFYAGAVGWSHRESGAETDDGEWLVAIRCAEVSADGRSITTWAGGGIVVGSDPEAELRETSAKFRTVFDALGITAEV